jgi:hypothetical protein
VAEPAEGWREEPEAGPGWEAVESGPGQREVLEEPQVLSCLDHMEACSEVQV